MGWYYVITQEIREAFEGKEADVFAVINGYSQEGQGCYFGSLALLSDYCGIKSKTTTQKILKSLIAKGAILKVEELRNGVKFCSYRVNNNWQGMSKIGTGGIAEIDTNNKREININKDSLYKGGSSHFQKPSLSEVAQYCRERANKVDPEQFYNFYESNGWKVGKNPMKDWHAAVRTWEKREKEVAPRKREPKEDVFTHNMRVMREMNAKYARKEVDVDEQ